MQGRVGRRGARGSIAAFAASLAFVAPPARGAEADAGAPPADASAEQVAARAYDLHAAGKYTEAIAAYLKAYELSNAGVALLNVATIYDRKLHERASAAEYYRRYLSAPDAEPALSEKASARLAALEHDDEVEAESHRTGGAVAPGAARTAPAPVPVAAAPAAAPPSPASRALDPRGSWKTVGLIAGGAGVASVGTSLVLGALALVKNRDADLMCNGSVCSGQDGVRLAQEAGRFATASTITFFAGLALVGGGLTIVLVAPRSPAAASGGVRRSGVALAPEAEHAIAGLSVRGGF